MTLQEKIVTAIIMIVIIIVCVISLAYSIKNVCKEHKEKEAKQDLFLKLFGLTKSDLNGVKIFRIGRSETKPDLINSYYIVGKHKQNVYQNRNGVIEQNVLVSRTVVYYIIVEIEQKLYEISSADEDKMQHIFEKINQTYDYNLKQIN